jgi:phosphate-selective porin OprO/OprP
VKVVITTVALAAMLLVSASGAEADGSVDERIRNLEELVRRQQEEIESLREGLAVQQQASDSLESELDRFLSKTEDANFWQQPNTMRAFWKNGLKFETADGKFKASVFGRVYFDMAIYDEDWDELSAPTPGPSAKDVIKYDTQFYNEVKTRTARLGFDTTFYTNSYAKVEIDFAGSKTALKDVYMEQKGIPVVGAVRVGHFKEPMGLEELTSSRYITFMERAMPIGAFTPSRNVGLMLHDKAFEDRLQWAGGVFATTDDQANGRTDPSITARISGTPYKSEDGSMFLHLGISGSFRHAADDKWRIKSTPEARTSLSVVDTGDITADKAMILGLEAAFVAGPFSLQAEYLTMDLDSEDFDDPRFDGWYILASYFLTGETRAYKSGAFDRVKVKGNLNDPDAGGPGAVELAARLSNIDLDDALVEGGKATNWTLGLNYYLNPHMRIMFNYVLSDIDDVGNLDVFEMRFQFDF